MGGSIEEMQDFSKRHRQRDLLQKFVIKVVGAILLIAVAFVAARAAYNMYGKFAGASEARKNAEERLALLVEQKEQVGSVVEALDSRRGVEAQIRERYGVAKPGEGRIEIVREGASTSPRSLEEKNIFVRFLDFIWPF